jgi:Tc5 transposase DNA-binding domain/helix-turn-helix, Psq domain
MDSRAVQTEGRLQLACQAYQKGQFRSIRGAVTAYDVPRTTLTRRVQGVPARRDSRPTNRKLTDTEEATLLEWILSMDQRGLAPRAAHVRQAANLLLAERATQAPPQVVGECWVRNFIKRQPVLQSKYFRKYDYQRALCEDPETIRKWFCTV